MSGEQFLKILLLAFLSCALGWVVFSRQDDDLSNDDPNKQRYLPIINSLLLPIYLICVTLLQITTYGFRQTLELTVPMCFTIFLHISIYYLILWLFSPLLRKRLSARACAALWIIPNYLYLLFNNSLAIESPKFILHISEGLFWILSAVWFLGFLLFMLFAYIQHFRFRKQILSAAKQVTEDTVLHIWNEELASARIKKPRMKLVVSNAVTAPLSIGFIRKTTCVVLPENVYTEEELALIFRHELIHISREDAANKFFMVFSKAICWFNPLMWIAMKKSAEDLELSCDETVLLSADDATRKTYADLILNSVQDASGFTTCLSSTAESLRYRLKSIVKKRTLSSGAVTIALISFVLFMTCGTVALAYGGFPARQDIFPMAGVEAASDLEIYGLNLTAGVKKGSNYCVDENALNAYIANLEVAHLNGNYSFNEYDNSILIFYEGTEHSFAVEIKDQIMEITPLGVLRQPMHYYHVQDDVNWEYLLSLFPRDRYGYP